MQEKQKNRIIRLNAFAKINLSLDVTGTRDDGMHDVDMIMQAISLKDDIYLSYEESGDSVDGIPKIMIRTNRAYLPTGDNNIAYKAAAEFFKGINQVTGRVLIEIKKQIPVAAGLAGGSSDASAVLHGLNAIFNYPLSMQNLIDIAKIVGSDVPFTLSAQAKCHRFLKSHLNKEGLSMICARAKGTGTDLQKIIGLKSYVVLAKPSIGVSTAEVYRGIDEVELKRRPDTEILIEALEEGNYSKAYPEMVNVLEEYTLQKYVKVYELKKLMKEEYNFDHVMMSGSGPTIIGFTRSQKNALQMMKKLRKLGYSAYYAKTLE